MNKPKVVEYLEKAVLEQEKNITFLERIGSPKSILDEEKNVLYTLTDLLDKYYEKYADTTEDLEIKNLV